MPRTYKPNNGSKSYKKYDKDFMTAALREYESTNTSFAEIGKRYGIPKSVLHRHYTRVLKKPGGQTVLNNAEELYIIEYLNVCSEWGYPLDTYDLRLLVKGYLDRIGINVKRFKDNLPGPDFINSFLRRHKNKISQRISQNIKKSRASVSPEIIEEYFVELEKSLEGVPLCNIINYDETNLSDDPGKRKVITKRGVKYPERVMNHSKTSTSLMMAAAADGTLLPCYVVYKSQHLYESWVQQGPVDCRYNRTHSGWFDAVTFDDWVHTVAFPYFENKTGNKIMIGDNLSSHLSINLIRECKEKGIHFIFLPANSTHLTQPLDVAFFRPTKSAWRDILFTWKKKDGRNLTTVPKSAFPSLLKKLLMHLSSTAKDNILAGFKKAGISPINKNKVLERLPGNNFRLDESFNKEAIDATVISLLTDMRYGAGIAKTSNRRKKIDVRPGQSVNTDTENADTEKADSDSGNSDIGYTTVLNREYDPESTDDEVNARPVTVSPQFTTHDYPLISYTQNNNLDCTTNELKTEKKRKKTEDVEAIMKNRIKKSKTDKKSADSNFKVDQMEAGPSTEEPNMPIKITYDQNDSQTSTKIKQICRDIDNTARNKNKSKQSTKITNLNSKEHAHVKPTTEQEDIIFKKPNIPPRCYGKKKVMSEKKSLQDDSKIQHSEQRKNNPKNNVNEFTIRNDIDDKFLDELDINKIPILSDEDFFCIQGEIEVEDIKGENHVRVESKNKKQNDSNKVQIIANEEIKGKLHIDLEKMRKISLNQSIDRKRVVKVYKNDSEILRDPMDENVT